MKYYFSKNKTAGSKKKKKILGGVIIFIGIATLLYFFFPVISYSMFFGPASSIEAPVPKYAVVGKSSLTSLISEGLSGLTTNFNDARNWYPTVHAATNTSVESYSLSIPKLKIENAEVSTVDYDLTNHLIQYAGTTIPGQNGTAVIFGHSTLPQLFNPKNYKTIFANLHTIQNGDEIVTKVNGVTYTYKVFSITITSPDDTNMFSQSYDHPYLTIITCTPPGTVWKRLIVRAALEDVGKTGKVIKADPVLAASFIN